jgi:hypothetical protein
MVTQPFNSQLPVTQKVRKRKPTPEWVHRRGIDERAGTSTQPFYSPPPVVAPSTPPQFNSPPPAVTQPMPTNFNSPPPVVTPSTTPKFYSPPPAVTQLTPTNFNSPPPVVTQPTRFNSQEERVERIFSPVKPKRLFRRENSLPDPATPEDFLKEFVSLRKCFSSDLLTDSTRIQLDASLKKISNLSHIIPEPEYLVGIEDEKVSPFKSYRPVLSLIYYSLS